MDGETLENVEGFGGVITESISSWFQDKKNLDQLMDLHNCGIRFLQDQKIQNQNFKDKSVVITGSFEDYKRDDLKKLLSLMGAKVQSSVSSKTDILICGLKPGSKFEKASKLGVKIIDEKQLSQLLS